MNIKELIVQLRIEEDIKKSDKRIESQLAQAKPNMVETNAMNKKREHSEESFKQGNNKSAK